MDPSKADKVPVLKDLTADNITENVIRINSQCDDARLKYILERLITHLHDFARETRLSSQEWQAGIGFLTDTGKICSDTRQEFVLLSDVFGLSILVDSIDHPKPPNSTEGTVLGPFHADAPEISHGDVISSDPNGEPMLVLCTLKDTSGRPIEGAKIDIWESDTTGHYDVQYSDRGVPDGRCVVQSDGDGIFWFKAIKPVPYPVPCDGPVGRLLERIHRHPFRPSHVHFMFEKEGYDHLITSLFIRDDPYETSDAVFGVKNTLVVDLAKVDSDQSAKYGINQGSWLMTYDFVLVSDAESSALRDRNSKDALDRLGYKVKIVNGLPVPDLD
jgi:protocatechuate 3,4-dioxygenase beta subunit